MCLLKSLFRKTDISKIAELVYKDSVQPLASELGQTLGDSLAILVSDNIRYLRIKRKMVLEKNLQKYSEKIKEIPKDKRVKVPMDLGVPILQKLTYTENDTISDMFINLLAKASTEETSELAHPSFINCINNMTSDEAKILIHLKDNPSLAYVILRFLFNKNEGLDKTCILTGLETTLPGLRFPRPDNIALYIDNLVGLGILKSELGKLSDEKKFYEPLYRLYEPFKRQIEHEGNGGKHYEVEYVRGYYNLTPYGRWFINACLQGIDLSKLQKNL